MTTDAEERSAWPRNGQVIRRDELLRLIEENSGPEGLDLRGAVFVGDGPGDDPSGNPIDLRAAGLAPLAGAYRQANGGSDPPWLAGDSINLSRAQLQGADLWGAQLQGAHLEGGQLQSARMTGAQLTGAHLTASHLQGAYLSLAQMREALLEYAELEGATVFATALDRADLCYANLAKVDLYDVRTVEGADWYGALLDHTRIKRESLGRAIGDELEAHDSKRAEDYHRTKEAYLLLKNNFNQIGRYEDASWAYVKERQMEKMAYHWEWRQQGWRLWQRYSSDPTDGEPQRRRRAWGSLWRWLRNWAYELATGYGERPWNPVIGGVLLILGFAGGFCATRAVANLWDALIYSLATFATFNLTDTGPTGRGADVASSVEALLGIAVLALVIFTLGNKMSRG